MLFNLNTMLLGLSNMVDCVEIGVLGVTTNHARRVAYIAARLGEKAQLAPDSLFDTVALALLHDNGLSEELLETAVDVAAVGKMELVETLKAHCEIGERNIGEFPFLTKVTDIVRLHHERWDGGGFFGVKGESVPIQSQVIGLADFVDFLFGFGNPERNNREKICHFIAEQRGSGIAPGLGDLFLDVASRNDFWLDLQDDFIERALIERTPKVEQELPWQRILGICQVFSRIIDYKSTYTQRHSGGLEDKAARMTEFYRMDEQTSVKFRIAASLHDLGKLAIPNHILDKPGRLDAEELRKIEEHSYYTKRCLDQMFGFGDVANWAGNHHERLDGGGYPRGLSANQLDFHSRLLACLDVYQALTEERPYRRSLSHQEAMAIIQPQAEAGRLDPEIVRDIDLVFEGA